MKTFHMFAEGNKGLGSLNNMVRMDRAAKKAEHVKLLGRKLEVPKIPVVKNDEIIGHARTWKQATELLGTSAAFEKHLVHGRSWMPARARQAGPLSPRLSAAASHMKVWMSLAGTASRNK